MAEELSPNTDNLGKRLQDLIEKLDSLAYEQRRWAGARNGFNDELLKYQRQQLDFLIVLEHRLNKPPR